jgi:hypothetical protein
LPDHCSAGHLPESWVLEPASDQAYKLTVTGKENKSGRLKAHLFKIKDEHHLDIIPDECEFAAGQSDLIGMAVFPGHLLVRVSQLEPELKIAFVDFGWLHKFLEENPGALAHHSEENRALLTATTRSLQRFVRKHSEGGLFQPASTLIRNQ